MKQLRLFATALLMGSILFTSCKDDDDSNDTPEPIEKTNKELLVAGSWMQTEGRIDPPILGNSDYFSEYEDCEKDDLYTFNNDNTYVNDEGETKCSQDDEQIISTGTWVMSANEETFTVTEEGGETTEFNIQSISATEMTVTISEVIGGETYTNTMKFKHP